MIRVPPRRPQNAAPSASHCRWPRRLGVCRGLARPPRQRHYATGPRRKESAVDETAVAEVLSRVSPTATFIAAPTANAVSHDPDVGWPQSRPTSDQWFADRCYES